MMSTKKKTEDRYSKNSIDVIAPRLKRFKVQVQSIQKICAEVSKLLGLKDWELSVKFVGKQKIAKLNDLYRGKNYATDVLSFPQTEWDEALSVSRKNKKQTQNLGLNMLGDIVICLDIALKNAEKIGQGLDREVCFLLVHGILHLCGHDHEREVEERVMLREQKKIMTYLNRDLPVWKNCVRSSKNT